METTLDHIQPGISKIQLIGQFWEQEDITVFRETTLRLQNALVKKIIIDLSRLSFINSLGLGSFVAIYTSAKTSQTELYFYKPKGSVRELMELSGFFSFMKVIETEEQLQQLYKSPILS